MQTALGKNTDLEFAAFQTSNSASLPLKAAQILDGSQASLTIPQNIRSEECREDWINFEDLLQNFTLDSSVLVFLDQTLSKTALLEIKEKLKDYAITEEQFVEFIFSFTEGLLRSKEKFKICLPEVELACAGSEHESRICYDPVDKKIRIGLKAIESFIGSPNNIHLAPFSLEIRDLSYFTGWEEGTHFAQLFSESQQKGLSQKELAADAKKYFRLFDINTNYIASCPFEVFAGFIIREEFRREFAYDPESLKLSFQQDLYVLDQIKKSGAKLDGWAKEIIEAKKNELTEVTAKTGQFPGLKPLDSNKVENISLMIFMIGYCSKIGAIADRVDRKFKDLTDKFKKNKILAPAFNAIEGIGLLSAEIGRFFDKREQKLFDWFIKRLNKD